jgi:cation/acetate symporter
VSAAFSLAAAGFFPALVMGIFWRRANGFGAVAGMLAGLGVCAYYMATNLPLLRSLLGVTRPLADCQWWGVDAIAAGVFGVPLGWRCWWW